MKPDSATAIPIRMIAAYDQPAHEAQPGRALARDPDPLGGRRAPRARGTRGRPARRARSRPGSPTPALIQVPTSTALHRRAQPRAILLRRPRHAALVRAARAAPARGAAPARRGTTSAPRRREAAIRAEIAYYRAHLDEGRDPESLRDLRARCAAAMAPALPGIARRRAARRAAGVAALLRLPRRRAGADGAARRRHPRSSSSPTGTGRCTSGSPRPGSRRSSTARSPPPRSARPSPTARSSAPRSELAGARPTQAWHVGDTPEADVEGARAAGLRPILIARDGVRHSPASRVIRSLAELIPLADLTRRALIPAALAPARGGRRPPPEPPPEPPDGPALGAVRRAARRPGRRQHRSAAAVVSALRWPRPTRRSRTRRPAGRRPARR